MDATATTTSEVTLGVLRLDPNSNPGVTASGTWSPEGALQALAHLPVDALDAVKTALPAGGPLPRGAGLVLHDASVDRQADATFVLASLPDGQRVLLELGVTDHASVLAPPLAQIGLADEAVVRVHATHADILHRYLRQRATSRGPRALGPIPRLGVGTRMTTACWPAIFEVASTLGLATNAIQNSVRELNFLEDLMAGMAPERNYAPGFGTIESGYTGSSFEGLWTWGVLDALQHGAEVSYGADADHIQIKRGPSGMAQAKRYVDSFRYYTFFTIDMADILDFGALAEPSHSAAHALSEVAVGDEGLHRDVVHYHRARSGATTGHDAMSEPLIHRLVAKYWKAFESLAELDAYLRRVKGDEPYDLEFTIDEHPPEIAALDCLSTREECRFIIDEAERRGLHVTHIAPNVGTEKGFDYRGADGIAGFEQRLRTLADTIAGRGMIIDVHSADDLGPETRAAVRRATGGRLHYKISPVLQLLFAEVLEEVHPDLFGEWWDDARAYARDEAMKGSRFAADCLARLDGKDPATPASHDAVFHHYSFRFPGRRDADGQFLDRERFYRLSPEFHRRHQVRITSYLTELATALFVG